MKRVLYVVALLLLSVVCVKQLSASAQTTKSVSITVTWPTDELQQWGLDDSGPYMRIFYIGDSIATVRRWRDIYIDQGIDNWSVNLPYEDLDIYVVISGTFLGDDNNLYRVSGDSYRQLDENATSIQIYIPLEVEAK